MEQDNNINQSGLDHIEFEESKEDNTVSAVGNGYYITSFGNTLFIDPKENIKFIKTVERIVRSSMEYKLWNGTLRKLGMQNCSFFGNVSDEDADIEIHHYPFSLYSIVQIVMDEMFSRVPSITTFSVANEVMKIHFEGLIGVVPLSETVHEAAHNGNVFIPLYQVFGDYFAFVEYYKSFITEDDFESLMKLVEMTKNGIDFTNNTDVLSYDSNLPTEFKDKNNAQINKTFLDKLSLIVAKDPQTTEKHVR
jgi:hypothetical protein